MYTLIDGVEFYDKEEIDDIVKAITGGTIPDEDNIRTELTTKINEEADARTAADETLGTRIDSEATKRMDADALLAECIADEIKTRMDTDVAFANQLTAIEQLHTTLISPNGFIDSDGDTVNVNDSGKSIRQIAHEEFYRQLITDADDVKAQLDTLKELADYLQRNPSIITDMYDKLGITWSVDNPTDFGTFDFSTVLTATNVDDAVLELYNTFTNKIGDLAQLTTAFKDNIVGAVNELSTEIDAEVSARTNADTVLGTRIDDEITARTDADTALGTRIDESIAESTALGTRIDDEVTARTDADAALDAKIGDLTQLNTTGKDTVVSAINSEFEWRRKNDETLGTRIDDEVTARTNADTVLGNNIGSLDNLKTTDKSSAVAAINELYDTVQQGGGTGNTVDYYVIEIEASFNGIKPNEPLRFEGNLDPDVANGITEAVAAGKSLMLKIVDSSADGVSPSTVIVITNYSYNDVSVYSFDMNDTTITGNQIIVVDYSVSIRPDTSDYSGYATLSTVTVPEGSGAGGTDIDIISIVLQSAITGNGTYTETVDLTNLATCITSNKPYLFEVTVQQLNYTFKNCPAILVKGADSTSFNISLLNDLAEADAATLTFTVNHVDATNTSVTFTMNDNVTIGGGSTGTDTTQLESKLNEEITARTQADADLNARIDAEIGDLSTLTTINKSSVVSAINEVKTLAGAGGGTVLPSDNSNVYVLQLTSNVKFDAEVSDTIALTPEQVTAVTNAFTNNVPIIAIVSIGTDDNISVVLTTLSIALDDNGNGGGTLANTLVASGPSDSVSFTTVMLSFSISDGIGAAYFSISNSESSSGGTGSGGDSDGSSTELEQRIAAVEATVTEKTRNIQAFTYVVDSNQTFRDWCNGVEGNDYSRVFIKNGYYSISNKTLKLVDVGTKYIYGETAGGVTLRFEGSLTDNLIAGDGTEDGVYNIKVSQFSDIDQYDKFCFYNLNNLVSCEAGVQGTLWNIDGCFGQCTNLKHCKAEARDKYGFSLCNNMAYCECDVSNTKADVQVEAFSSCRNLYCCQAMSTDGNSNSGGAIGFDDCNVLYNCESYIGNNPNDNCSSFINCGKMFQCIGTEGKSSMCYADSKRKYAAGEGPDGGFNEI